MKPAWIDKWNTGWTYYLRKDDMKSVQKRLEEGEQMTVEEWMTAIVKEMDVAAEAYAKTEERPSYAAIQRYKWAMFRNAVRYFDAMRARAKKQ